MEVEENGLKLRNQEAYDVFSLEYEGQLGRGGLRMKIGDIVEGPREDSLGNRGVTLTTWEATEGRGGNPVM